MANEKKTVREPSFILALVPIVAMIGFMLYCFHGHSETGYHDAHLPLVMSIIVACIVGFICGHSFQEMLAGMVERLAASMEAVLILATVGFLVTSFMLSGAIPTMIVYGLDLLTPKLFLPVGCILCAIVGMACGSSWTTTATIGLAFLGIGAGLGIPAPITAGMIISGAYVGDKFSPLSDTTNLASGITGTNIFSHIGSMLYTTVPATLVALGLYWYLGLNYSGGAMPDLTPITDALSANFNRSFLLALPPIVLVALAIRGIPPLPTLVIAILVGVVCAFVIQDGMTVKGMFKAATDGYVSQTGHPLVDKILSRGGLTSMSFVVFLLLIAMTLGGILEGTGALGVVVDRMTRSVTSPGGLILATLVSCYLMTIGTGNGMLSIIVPARAFEKKFRDMGIQSRVLSRTLEDAVTLGIALVPYSMAAFFIVGVLKIDAMQYIPYAFVNWIVPIFSLTYGFTGFAIWKINKDAGNSPAESEA